MSRVDRYVDDLLGQRRPQPFPATDAEAAELRTAIELRAANSAAAAPTPEFVADLGSRLAAAVASTAADDAADDVAADGAERVSRFNVPNRRRFVRTATVAAASAAGAVLVDRLVSAGGTNSTTDTAIPQETLQPDTGTWHTVLAAEQLPEGAVRAFDAGTVAGFVRRTPAGIQAVSSACTHLGCRLLLKPATEQLECPCHHAIFALTGDVVYYRLPIELRPLPRIQARESNGAIQVFVPAH